jgi:hypothetical protein
MNEFHCNRLRSGIQESHRIAVQPDWAFALRKQARLLLLPLWRKVAIQWTTERGIQKTQLTELAEELFRVYSYPRGISSDVHFELNEVLSPFVGELSISDKSILKFYFLSEDENLEFLERDETSNFIDDLIPINKLNREVGKQFASQFKHYADNNLTRGILDELRETENLISNSDCEIGLDAESIPRINEAFSNYLDLPYGVVSLIPLPINEYDFWECEFSEERTTIKKRFHTPEALEWKECWQLANGEIRVKGNLDDQEEQDNATLQFLKKELTKLLAELEIEIITQIGIEGEAIQYTFFTRRRCEEGLNLSAGIAFFSDEVKRNGADDFEPKLNIEIQTKQGMKLGTQLSLGPDQILYLEKDQSYEHRVWVFHIGSEQFQLETKVGKKQRKKLIQGIIEAILNSGEN